MASRRDVGTSLIDHADDAEGNADLREPDARGECATTHDLADGVRLASNLPHGRDDAVDARVVQHEPIEHGPGHAVCPRAPHVRPVRREDTIAAVAHGLGRTENRVSPLGGTRLASRAAAALAAVAFSMASDIISPFVDVTSCTV